MSETLEKLLPHLQALDPREVRRPDIPVATFIKEGDAMLSALGKSPELSAAVHSLCQQPLLVEQTHEALDALRAAQYMWLKERAGLTPQQVVEALAQGYATRDEVCALCIFYARHDRLARARLHLIRAGEGDADMVQDLVALAAFLLEEAKLFASRHNFSPKHEANRLVLMAQTLGLLVEQIPQGPERRHALDLRDRAYTHAATVFEEVRGAGRLLTRHDPEAHAIFTEYYKLTNLRRISA